MIKGFISSVRKHVIQRELNYLLPLHLHLLTLLEEILVPLIIFLKAKQVTCENIEALEIDFDDARLQLLIRKKNQLIQVIKFFYFHVNRYNKE